MSKNEPETPSTTTKNLDDYLASLGIGNDSIPKTSAFPQKAPPQAILEEFLSKLGEIFDHRLHWTMSEQDSVISIDIDGKAAEQLIKDNEEVAHALEYLLYTILLRRGYGETKLRLDIAGFRKRQDEQLTKLALRIAQEVSDSGQAHALQPMNSYHRRVMHMALQDHPTIETESHGEGKGRHLVIKPRL